MSEKRTMTQALVEIAPNTVRMFSAWLMESYGMPLKDFENATIKRKYFEVCRYFGYSLNEPSDIPVPEIIGFIKKTFAEYEEIMLKYPDGMKNPLLILKDMDYHQRSEWLAKHFISERKISLRDALVSGISFLRVSLKDSITAMKLTVLQIETKERKAREAAEEKFWSDIVKNFNQNELVPF